jgi:hypothetical protein
MREAPVRRATATRRENRAGFRERRNQFPRGESDLGVVFVVDASERREVAKREVTKVSKI